MFLLSKTNLAHGTVKRRVKALKSLTKHVDVFNEDAVVRFLNTCSWSNGTKNIVLQAYQDWLRMYGLPKLELAKYHVTERLPFIPLEKEIDTLISSARHRLSCFLKLLKETGVRPIEACARAHRFLVAEGEAWITAGERRLALPSYVGLQLLTQRLLGVS